MIIHERNDRVRLRESARAVKARRGGVATGVQGHRSGYPKAEGVKLDKVIALEANRGPDEPPHCARSPSYEPIVRVSPLSHADHPQAHLGNFSCQCLHPLQTVPCPHHERKRFAERSNGAFVRAICCRICPLALSRRVIAPGNKAVGAGPRWRFHSAYVRRRYSCLSGGSSHPTYVNVLPTGLEDRALSSPPPCVAAGPPQADARASIPVLECHLEFVRRKGLSRFLPGVADLRWPDDPSRDWGFPLRTCQGVLDPSREPTFPSTQCP